MEESIIQTERVLLRKFDLSDAPAVLEFGSNMEVLRFTGETPLHHIDQAKNIIKNTFQKDYEQYGYGRWAVVYKPENRVIGFAGLKYLPEFCETDIGYRVLPAYWNQGLTTEMCTPIIGYGFEHFNLNKIIGIALPDNIASCRVLEKIGLHFKGIRPYNDEIDQVKWYELKRTNYLKKI